MRKRLWWDSSIPMPEHLSMIHMDHCIDQLRQSLACSSDVTPIPYVWYPQYNSTLPQTGITHTCRNFDAIRDWAREHESKTFDSDVRVENPFGEVVHVFGTTKDA